jgi:hypothetical protein
VKRGKAIGNSEYGNCPKILKGVETDGLPEFYLIFRTNATEIYVGTGSHALYASVAL